MVTIVFPTAAPLRVFLPLEWQRNCLQLTVVFKEEIHTSKLTPWPQSASDLYRLSYRRLSAKLVPHFADRGCHVVSVTDPYGRILGFLDRSRYFFYLKFFFLNSILFAICTSTFSKLCVTYTLKCRRVLSSAPL
jgi:hypothetical protein